MTCARCGYTLEQHAYAGYAHTCDDFTPPGDSMFYDIRRIPAAEELRPDADGLVRFSTICPRCHGPNDHAIEPEFVALVSQFGICADCVERVR